MDDERDLIENDSTELVALWDKLREANFPGTSKEDAFPHLARSVESRGDAPSVGIPIGAERVLSLLGPALLSAGRQTEATAALAVLERHFDDKSSLPSTVRTLRQLRTDLARIDERSGIFSDILGDSILCKGEALKDVVLALLRVLTERGPAHRKWALGTPIDRLSLSFRFYET